MPKFTKGSKAASLAGKLGAAKTNAARKSNSISRRPSVREKFTHYMLLIDKSGSMSHLRSQVVGAINKQIAAFKATSGSTASASIYHFGSGSQLLKKIIKTPVTRLTEYNLADYTTPDGSTAIVHALTAAAKDLEAGTNQSEDYANVVILVTDGGENETYVGALDYRMLQETIKRLTATDRYTFGAVGPRDCQVFFSALGFAPGNIAVWEQTQAGAQTMGTFVQNASVSYSTSRAAGQTYSTNLFTPNLAKLKTTQVKRDLTNRSKDFKPWTVDKEVDIKTFVESHNVSFVLGAGYYPLTKPEKVQKTKQIVLVKKGTKEVYAGAEARELLGLPDEDTKVTPGNHGDWDIYVQSTSHNRKLVRGTKLLWDLTHTVDSKHTWADPTK